MSYSPLQRLEDARLNRHKLQLFIKRDDLLTPSVSTPPPTALSGNKLRKLKYNVSEMRRQNLHRIVTFGGAFSNHIHATAAAGQFYGFETIGIIRGERPEIGRTHV